MESPIPVIVYAEATPNPSTMKYVANRPVLADGRTAEYTSKESTSGAPMAIQLFQFDFVQAVFFCNNYVTVTKKEGYVWGEINGMLREFVKSYLEQQLPVILVFPEHKEVVAPESLSGSEALTKINELLDTYIRPAVEQDGGAIVLKGYDETTGVVTVILQGSCSGCPSSQTTIKKGVERMLTMMVPGVKEVIAEEV